MLNYVLKSEIIHDGSLMFSVTGVIDTRYTCCEGDLEAEGCGVARVSINKCTNKYRTMKLIDGVLLIIFKLRPIVFSWNCFCRKPFQCLEVEISIKCAMAGFTK